MIKVKIIISRLMSKETRVIPFPGRLSGCHLASSESLCIWAVLNDKND